VFRCEFGHAYFNGLLWQQLTFKAYLLPEKSSENFEDTFGDNGQLSLLKIPGWPETVVS
jgi:hypothetical protein